MQKQNRKPQVSVIVPCYNEENTIALLLNAIRKQTYPVSHIEVVIADSMSKDRTREKIQDFTRKNPDLTVRVVDNPTRTIPSGVNIAAKTANGDILVRMDAHSEPNPEYIATSVEMLENGKADNVGGVWEIQPGNSTCIARAIAKAAGHPLGAGDAKYRVSDKAQYVDTVPFGAFYREKFFSLGAFDESLLANEDYEFNARLQQAGGKVWMDPRIRSKYYARENLKKLAIQYWRYGFWKVKMLQRFPGTLKMRQAIPPLFVLSFIVFSMLSFIFPFALIILLGEIILYLLALLLAGIHSSIKNRTLCCMFMPAAILVMHFSWGAGFLFSLVTRNSKG